jgi:hypothetical protein
VTSQDGPDVSRQCPALFSFVAVAAFGQRRLTLSGSGSDKDDRAYAATATVSFVCEVAQFG